MQPDVDGMVEFVRAQLDHYAEVADRARLGTEGRWVAPVVRNDVAIVEPGGDAVVWDEKNPEQSEHVALNDPASVLRQVAAHRAILDDILAEPHRTCAVELDAHGSCHCGRDERVLRRVRLLASAYDDRDGYDEAWRSA